MNPTNKEFSNLRDNYYDCIKIYLITCLILVYCKEYKMLLIRLLSLLNIILVHIKRK